MTHRKETSLALRRDEFHQKLVTEILRLSKSWAQSKKEYELLLNSESMTEVDTNVCNVAARHQ